MSRHISHQTLIARNEVATAPAPRACNDHSFELPAAVYGMMAAFFVGFVGVLCLALRNPGLAVPFGIIMALLAAFFTVPALFVQAAPEDEPRSSSWSRFIESGIAIDHGHCSGREAVVLALLLPGFIFLWGIAVATIVSLV
jgi:TctA family transporter